MEECGEEVALGSFRPAWVLAVWGLFLVLDAWEVFYGRDVTGEDIQREMRRFSWRDAGLLDRVFTHVPHGPVMDSW